MKLDEHGQWDSHWTWIIPVLVGMLWGLIALPFFM